MDHTSGPLVTAVGLATLLYSEYADFRTGVWICKPLASLGFLLTASPSLFSSSPAQPSAETPSSKPKGHRHAPILRSTSPPPPSATSIFRTTIFGSLVLCFLGDVLLIPSGTSPFFFKAGLFAFLLGHVGFAAAFAQRDIDPKITALAAAAQAAFGAAAWKWLSPVLPQSERTPVALYISVICAMGATAIGGAKGWFAPEELAGANEEERAKKREKANWRRWVQIAGAVLFEVSDLCVARQQFVVKDFVNPLVGLPLYYAATTLLATLTWP